jgi:hypothetical protein
MKAFKLGPVCKTAGAVGAATAGLGAAHDARAEVIAQAVNVGIPPTYAVDLNGDMSKELDIIDLGDNDGDPSTENITKVANFANGVGVVLGGPDDRFTANLAEGTLIGPSSLFSGPADNTVDPDISGLPPDDALNGFDGNGPVGEFQVDDPAGFIGVQFRIAGQTHYGYVGFQGVETNALNDGPEGRVFALGYENNPGAAIAAGAGLPEPPEADFDADGDVDGEDFLIWQRGLGLTGQTDNTNGDADGSGIVDRGDLDLWEGEFGTGGSATAAAGVVPEPASLALLAAGAAGIALYRRRNS